MYAQNSTTGRSEMLANPAPTTPKSMPARGRAMRAIVGALGEVSPELAARFVTRIWFTPPKRALTQAERIELETGERFSVTVDGRRVAAWSFGAGPVVLLVHGWGGHAGQLVGFAKPLVDAGARAVLLDGLGHGQSDSSTLGRRQGSFVDFASCMQAVVDRVGAPYGIVAHSGGAIASGIALSSGLSTTKLALLAPMVRPLFYAEQFERMLGLAPEVVARWRALSEARARFKWGDIDLTTAAARFPLPNALVIHDRKDKEVPLLEGEALCAAWPNAKLIETTGLGHQRLLRDPGVIRNVMEFIGAE